MTLPSTVTTDPDVKAAAVAVLPIGSFEQHGPHLPLVTDTLIATAITAAIAQRHRVLELPPVTISCSHEHAAFPGTVSITATTLAAIITDVADSLHARGITGLLIVNGHGGNYTLANVAQQISAAGTIKVGLYPLSQDWQHARDAAEIETSPHDDMHAGELETSILLATHPDQVRPGWQHADHDAPERPHLLTLGISAYTDSGIIGMPSTASTEKGRRALEYLAERADTFINFLNEPAADK